MVNSSAITHHKGKYVCGTCVLIYSSIRVTAESGAVRTITTKNETR